LIESDNKLVVVYLPREWHIYQRRPHWLALSKHYQLLMIEPVVGILTAWKHPKRILELLKGKRLRRGEKGIYFYRPLLLASPLVDFVVSPLAKIDRYLMKRILKKIIDKLPAQFKHLIAFINNVHQYHFAKLQAHELCVYEVTDLGLLPHGQQTLDESHWYTKKAMKHESRLVSVADIIITSSKLIGEKWRTVHSNIQYLPNCADFSHFSRAVDEDLAVPSELSNIPPPRLGFVGYINHLIDFELVNKLAIAKKNVSIVIIGSEQRITGIHKDAHYRQSQKITNIHFLGFKPYNELPKYLKGFDVCLMPFRLNEWMRYSAPNKVYQYLAAGKPVVSTNFTETEVAKDVISIARDHQGFIDSVTNLLNESNTDNKHRRLSFAKEHSTEARAEKVAAIINATLRN